VIRVSAPHSDDLTARARIRQAALEQFAQHGYERTTIRGIAAAAAVSPGLVRHHFGSKEALRDAVDAHVMSEIRRVNDEILAGSERGDLAPAAFSQTALTPFQNYLVQALVDGSPTMARLFDQMIGLTEQWLEHADAGRKDEPMVDRRIRAAVLNAMAMGIPLLREHISRAVGTDMFSPEGFRLVALASLDIYSHALLTPELADSARAGLDAANPPTIREQRRR
jgi:AcrR family transcriptional regulator